MEDFANKIEDQDGYNNTLELPDKGSSNQR
jgi:hypothetical protein